MAANMADNLLLFSILIVFPGAVPWQAHDYWNDRYQSEGLTAYDTDDTYNGLWSHHSTNRGNHGRLSTSYSSRTCGGCSCDTIRKTVKNCAGSTVNIRHHDFPNITAETFTNPGITSITITDCTNFDTIGNDTFKHLTNLQELRIEYTKIDRLPDISTTKMRILNLAHNEIKMTTNNEVPQVLPSTLTHVSLVHNKIHWVPDGLFKGTNVETLAFGYNEIEQFPDNTLGNMPNLQYLGLDNNKITAVSRSNIGSLADCPKFQHLNLSNNGLRFIEQGALSQLKELLILELHQNELSTLEKGVINNIPKLLHLDLNKNRLKVLPSEAITNLPELITLRLHSQKDRMTTIMYDSIKDANLKLRNLWISDNALTHFPHEMLLEQNYPLMDTIWADNNLIRSIATFERSSYPLYMQAYYDLQRANQKPFETISNLKRL